MPLNAVQVEELREAIEDYAFPAVYYDFLNDQEVLANGMAEVERVIGFQLRSGSIQAVKDGLANILYWGFARIGYRDRRVNNLRGNATDRQLENFQELVSDGRVPTMNEVRVLRIPEYSGMSFLSKILMFLDPSSFCVLDRQIARLRTHNSPKALNALSFGPRETQIRITTQNEQTYDSWRNECRAISVNYFQHRYRVVDIERGFFNLIQNGRLSLAQQIYNEA